MKIRKSNNKFMLTNTKIGAMIILICIAILLVLKENKKNSIISDYFSCVKAGGQILESHPPQCVKQGKTYTQPLQNVKDPDTGTEKRKGRVTAIDYTPLTTGNDVPVTIEVEPGVEFTYFVGTDNCEEDFSLRELMRSKDIQVGDIVELQARTAGLQPDPGNEAIDDIGFARVCGEGTYIKKLDPSASWADHGDNSIMSEWVTVRGMITSLNLETMDNTGTAGSMTIRSEKGETYEISVGSKRYLDGPSLCDRPDLPANLSKNANVEVRGEEHVGPGGSKSLTVCARETFIKLL